MKVKIGIEFYVDTDDDDVARSAASQAAYHFLALVMVSGHSTDSKEVEVDVDGVGSVTVSLGTDHE